MPGLYLPAPHLLPQVNAGAWRVECVPTVESAVDTANRVAMLPEPDTIESLMVQCHEQEHVYRSHLPGCDAASWQARGEWWASWRKMIEEIAVDVSHQTRTGFDLRRRHDGFDWADMQTSNWPKTREQRGQMYLQLANSISESQNADLASYWGQMLAEMAADDKGVLLKIATEIQRDYSPASCDSWTDFLVKGPFPPPPPPKPPEPQRETAETQSARVEAQQERAKLEKAADQRERKSGESDQTAEHLDRDASEYVKRLGADGGAGTPDNMLLDVHRHTGAHMRPAMCGRTWRPTDVGSTVRYPLNYPNGAVFARRSRGGSIIMDWSGSMAWDWQELKDALRQTPALWCAGYSHHADAYYGSNYVARLCILAEGGRLGTWEQEREHTGGNSGSDPASLAYMVQCRQATPPYIWVSDGLVGKGYVELTDSICRKAGIIRVASLTDAIDLLRGRRVEQFPDASSGYAAQYPTSWRHYVGY